MSVPGTPMDFVFNSRDKMAAAIIAFLGSATAAIRTDSASGVVSPMATI